MSAASPPGPSDTLPAALGPATAALPEVLPEEWLRIGVDTLVRLVEAAGAVVIFIGALVAVVQFVRVLPRRDPEAFVPVRLSLGRYLALGLEFQLASDVLRTAIAPSFDELGKLAAVAAIRIVLNFFLSREIAEEQRIIAARGDRDRPDPAPAPPGPVPESR